MQQLRGVQLKRYIRKLPKHDKDIVVVCDNVQYGMNVGSIFRIADGAGITKLYLCGISKTPSDKTVREVGRSKHKTVQWEYVKDTSELLPKLGEEGYEIIALEITNESIPYYNFNPLSNKIAIVVGNEEYGITKKTLSLCDTSVYIPMYGKGKSLNVHISLGVFIFNLLKP